MSDQEGLTHSSERLLSASPDETGVQEPDRPRLKIDAVELEIRLLWGGIDEIGERLHNAELPVDAISVGHYAGYGKPLAAELALDKSISKALMPNRVKDGEVPEPERVLSQYAERGIVQGDLGRPFLMPDPRVKTGRIIVLAGMGVPGRFGEPELTVLARELCWCLGRLNRKHLATVLIGSGQGNIQLQDAVSAWVRGARHALTGSRQDEENRLHSITFVEIDPRKLDDFQKAVLAAIAEEGHRPDTEPRLKISYKAYTDAEFKDLRNGLGQSIAQATAEREARDAQKAREAARPDALPSRLTLGFQGRKYHFGAITEDASIPEREITLNPDLVRSVNDTIVGQTKLEDQFERGRHLGELLVPQDLDRAFGAGVPVVMMLDSASARIHWEMVALNEVPRDPEGSLSRDDAFDSFLSTSRGFTRQLRTTFAPPPEPPPPPRRILQVLIVADPAQDRPLKGARREGNEVAELLRAFDTIWKLTDNQVQVDLLSGADANIGEVHYRLTRHHYDVLHFAGHCVYDKDEPTASGWIFTGGARLTANELNRIDRVPKFVFSNACESGVTRDNPEGRTAELAPTFAEAFFGRGVANFVCTAWPVNDDAALQFAISLYSSLLGLKMKDGNYQRAQPEPMYRAMQQARRTVALMNDGVGLRTWGAYQHYGSPYLRFFDRSILDVR
jgi:hypothetical protein